MDGAQQVYERALFNNIDRYNNCGNILYLRYTGKNQGKKPFDGDSINGSDKSDTWDWKRDMEDIDRFQFSAYDYLSFVRCDSDLQLQEAGEMAENGEIR